MNLDFSSRLAVVALTAAVLILYLTHSLFSAIPLLIGVQVVAGLLMLWARLTFGRRSFHATATPTEGGLVTTGPYAFLRHPIYAALLLMLAVAIAAHPSARNAGLVALAVAAIAVRIAAEEHLVRARYPEYLAYAARTKRLIPYSF